MQLQRRWTQTVDRALVHRASVAEVLLTGWSRTGPAQFTVDAQWPRSHPLYVDRSNGRHDPSVLVESLRQAVILLSQAELGAKPATAFVMLGVRFVVKSDDLVLGLRPADIEMTITAETASPSRTRWEAHCLCDGRTVGTVQGAVLALGPDGYAALRGSVDRSETIGRHRPPDRLTPPRVGRERAHDVVLFDTDHKDRWRLWVDPGHAVLFDHTSDHVPGMALLEGVRQAAVTGSDRPLVVEGLEMAFHRFVEFAEPAFVVLPRRGEDAKKGAELEVHVEQGGRVAARGRLRTSPL